MQNVFFGRSDIFAVVSTAAVANYKPTKVVVVIGAIIINLVPKYLHTRVTAVRHLYILKWWSNPFVICL